MKYLNGSEIAGFIKERQAKEVRRLLQVSNIRPKLVIISTNDDPASQIYMKLKKSYGQDILIDVEVVNIDQADAVDTINKLNADQSVHGIIVQLPLADNNQQNEILDAVAKDKDVDGLGKGSSFTPATPLAITWLLDGYNIDITNKKILIIGKGRLVGSPLLRLWQDRNLDVAMADTKTKNIEMKTLAADVIVTATGRPGLIASDMLESGAIVVDAGVAEVDGKPSGDLGDTVYERSDLTLTPKKGGVGPLTVCALFDNVIKSANS